jgi:hypothetical protein
MEHVTLKCVRKIISNHLHVTNLRRWQNSVKSLKNFNEQIKFVIFCIGLGVSLVVYANANFSTSKQTDLLGIKVEKIESSIEKHPTKEDFKRLEDKVDAITFYLLELKK